MNLKLQNLKFLDSAIVLQFFVLKIACFTVYGIYQSTFIHSNRTIKQPSYRYIYNLYSIHAS